ncbi:pectate lyase [Clavibacter sepedonicus]|uniref:Pectate lyase n=2 Tax=Microbacteriaceae TaxID=85023 RepID=B0RG35_CLASE|nr:pectate lyase [Clavibacter sp.]OQJ47925.1 pectate lyase [Clavibacter sepedonicus]OQJ53482.1 pectate lyase [Clavibacter sepedonicus]CAQ02326.1 putative secreted pectate lyase [Clavibacter sepedonicus]
MPPPFPASARLQATRPFRGRLGAVAAVTAVALLALGLSLPQTAPAQAAGLPARGSSISDMPAFPTPTHVAPAQSMPFLVKAGQTVDFHNQELNASTNGHGEFQEPVVLIEPGGIAENLIIGPLAGDGIHCQASCTLINIWWPHVGEDAVTLLDGSPASSVVTIRGGAVAHAYDKVVQLDGAGTARFSDFAASDIGTLARSCGNCPNQYTRHIVISNVFITGGKYKVAGVNQNFGDTATLDHVTIHGVHMQVCDRTIGGRGTAAKPVPGAGGPFPPYCVFDPGTILYS